MIKRKNGTECYSMEEVTNIFIFKTHAKNLDSFVENNWTTCTSCGLMFRLREDKSELCYDKCTNYSKEIVNGT